MLPLRAPARARGAAHGRCGAASEPQGREPVQVDPNAATLVLVQTPRGGELSLDPGREVVARVVAASGDGNARINLAGQLLDVRSDVPLRAGDDVRLAVSQADAAGVRLAIVTPEQAGTGNRASTLGARLVQELARAGVPVSPQLAAAASQVAAAIGGDASAVRAVANLASRDLVLSPAAAGRVAAALDLAGSLGPALSSLAARSGDVAAALPSGAPTAAALRSLLAPGLSSSELAIARIVQATQASAPGGPTTIASPPTGSSAAVIQNYVTSQLSVASRLDQLAVQNTTLGTAELLQSRTTTPPAAAAPANAALARAALDAALRGQAAAGSPASRDVARPAALPTLASAAPAAATATAAQSAQSPARAAAGAAAATGAIHAMPTQTTGGVARAVADLTILASRFAPAVAPAAGAIREGSAAAARGMSATEIAQQAGRAGSIGPASATVAGAGAGGDPLPLVTALRAWLASPGAEQDAAKLLRSLGGASPTALATALGTLAESQSLRLAGQLLGLLPSSTQLGAGQLQDLRAGVHAALNRLGGALVPPATDDVSTLRAALELVAASDPRPGVAGDAARLLAAVDGQQILSRASAGSDPGYVYFQVPMPDGRGAEVLVRREPGRRQVSFDEFRIAFLLDTERLGTLMIELDAHPAGIRADVRTDLSELEPYLRARGEDLVEPLAREARRPVTVTTGVFEDAPPTSLLEQPVGALEPGATEFYA